MGRHSAPDDDEEPQGPVAVTDPAAELAEQLAAERRGRHSHGADADTTGPVPGVEVRRDEERAAVQDERPTERIDLAVLEAALEAGEPVEPVDVAEPAEPAEPVEAAEPAAPAEPAQPSKRGRAAQSTAADLALLRRHGDVRNRVLGAALVPFVLYAAVLLVLTTTGVQYLLWIWIPMVTAGVLVGFVLDSGHKRYPMGPEQRPT